MGKPLVTVVTVVMAKTVAAEREVAARVRVAVAKVVAVTVAGEGGKVEGGLVRPPQACHETYLQC